ncbi:uncharacterized protein BJX67DRAFT_389330 [Aspergillus lucknowensis]|uniref:F-box domain-containing protein n=1 Tax=Aspergillus lucknowensis TaxID=176173 RepID=A0ABR4LM04_9EURO
MPGCIRKLLGFVRVTKQRADYELLSLHKEPPRALLLELPLKILLLIVPHLPLVSQACLVLTCKHLYRLLRSALDDEVLAWPKYLTSPITPWHDPPLDLFRDNPEVPRNDFLLKLEDAWWLYCCKCLKLHPSYQFKPWFVGPWTPPSTRFCNSNVGVVDLCACLSLTYWNGVQLAMVNNKQCLLHKCSVISQPNAFVALTTMVTFDTDCYLVVTTRYNVYLSSPHKKLGETVDWLDAYRPPPNTEGIFVCPHMHALAWLYGRYWKSSGCQYSCECCDTNCHLLFCTYDGLHSVIKGERNLGIIRFDTYRFSEELERSCRWRRTSRRPRNAMETTWYHRVWAFNWDQGGISTSYIMGMTS